MQVIETNCVGAGGITWEGSWSMSRSPLRKEKWHGPYREKKLIAQMACVFEERSSLNLEN